jgi:uncharacterized protein YodC (DUF2158 family)
MASKFKAGEKVLSKGGAGGGLAGGGVSGGFRAGGAVMTIQAVNVHAKARTRNPKPTKTVRCTWFDGVKMQTATFHQNTLKVAKGATVVSAKVGAATIKKRHVFSRNRRSKH